MSKKTTVIVTTGLIAIVAITATTAILKNRAKPQLADDQPIPTVWNDSSMLISPFTAVRFDGDTVLVTYAGSEYQLAVINGVAAAEIVGFGRAQYRDQWQKKCSEDLIAVLSEMGHPVHGDTVSLSLVDPANGQSKEIADAKMTRENRSSVHRALASAMTAPKQAQ